MSAPKAVMEARAAGIQFGVEGDDLVLEAAAAPPAAILDLLSRHKPDILVLLRPGRDGWSAKDWQVFFDERAGIAEFDGGLSRPEAETRAFDCCVVEWLNRNPASCEPGHCSWCGKPDPDGHTVIPFGTASHDHAWLHPECWANWFEHRRQVAAETLMRMGIRPAARPKGKND